MQMNKYIEKENLLLSEADAANILGIKRRTLQQWRHSKKGPTVTRVGERMVRYRWSDLNAWLAQK